MAAKLLSDLASGVTCVPSNYVRPVHDRPSLDQVEPSDHSIPLINLHGFDGSRRHEIINQIGLACQNYGFFQVQNHAIEDAVIDNMLKVAREFFHLPESERLKCFSEDPLKTTRLSTSFNVKTEEVSSWRDYLRLHCYPLEDYMHEWPSNPPSFRSGECQRISRETSGSHIRKLRLRKGLHEQGIGEAWAAHGHQLLSPLPSAELTYGLPGHADPNVVTLLLQDDVAGLQVFNNGRWVAVKPMPHTFIVNIGDQIQVVSNDRYKSVLHRAVVNCDKERISIPTFYCPSYDAVMEPAPQLVDDHHPPLYRRFTYAEFYEKFWDRGLNTRSSLDLFKTTSHA
ncbi:2-oxoglutarate and Fe(II)-dependent oxygenase superfamily protein [Prunus dulcis]|uniref:2-oxoglutarate and Fe(II)-dependent oxygenase superfamily protein n=1 Tax=Prunus dulcis TaxID=3755 RepID=A0A4Y1R0U7_PRUDU|nr:2-oxoglutarate and Fe(II)-dependent oxygenase superfamily protein [Prunus dulcis]